MIMVKKINVWKCRNSWGKCKIINIFIKTGKILEAGFICLLLSEILGETYKYIKKKLQMIPGDAIK